MHSSMDKPNEEPRPYCQQCKKWFRKWGTETTAHKLRHPSHVLVTKFYRTR